MPLPGSSDQPSPPPPRPPPRGQLSAGLRALADRARVGDLTLGGADDHLQGETAHLLCAIMALPFCQPVPLIGLSTPLGLALAVLLYRRFGTLDIRRIEAEAWSIRD
ncbi:MAG: exopolysaccharide biosynthesis protein [Verrucomicrobiota bacterium]